MGIKIAALYYKVNEIGEISSFDGGVNLQLNTNRSHYSENINHDLSYRQNIPLD